MVIGPLLLLAGFTVFIVKYLLELDKSRLGGNAPTSTMMKKLSGESQSSKPIHKPTPRKRKPRNTGYSSKDNADSGYFNQQGNHFEIYLKAGGVVIAEKWWEQGDMIMYKTRLGTMGIEKDAVKHIVSK